MVEFYGPLLVEALRGHEMSRIESDWPADAEIVDVRMDFDRRVIQLMVESASFDEVPEGHLAPAWAPSYTRYQTEASELLNLIHREMQGA